MIKKAYIKITSIPDLQEFVRIAMHTTGSIDVSKGRYCVDGRSLLGVFGIDTSTGVLVEYPDTATEFENFIKQFIVVEDAKVEAE